MRLKQGEYVSEVPGPDISSLPNGEAVTAPPQSLWKTGKGKGISGKGGAYEKGRLSENIIMDIDSPSLISPSFSSTPNGYSASRFLDQNC